MTQMDRRTPSTPPAGDVSRFREDRQRDSINPGLDKKPGVRTGGKATAAWLALAWERLWPRLWPLVSLTGLFVATALFDVVPDLPGWQHVAILALFGAALAGAIWYARKGFVLPTRADVMRRLERDSALEHRPLETLQDDLSVGGGDPAAEAVWRAHQERARKSLSNLKVGGPRPLVARLDKFALRGAVLVVLALAVTVGWADSGTRLSRMFMPSFDPASAAKVTVEAWITPPDYTGQPPRMVSSAAPNKPIVIPAGSKIMIQVHGGRGTPKLQLGRQSITLRALDEHSHQAELFAFFNGRLTVTQRGRDVVDWKIVIQKDEAPKVAFTKKPSITQRQSVQLDYTASDDFRLNRLRAYIARYGEVDVIELKLPGSGVDKIKTSSFHDLTGHRWAGLKVSIVLEALDDQHQRGRSKIHEITLPERNFSNPVARAIVAQRKNLTVAPEETHAVIRALGHLANNPQLFLKDHVVYLSLRIAQARLIIATKDDGRSDGDVRVALRVEEGRLSAAERELRRIQRELTEKLGKKDPPPKDIKKLLEELREAMREYMKALREDMRKNPHKYQNRPRDPNAKQYTEQDMKRFMQQLRDLYGDDKKALQKYLAQLRKMIENLKNGTAQQNRQLDPNHPARRLMRELADIIRKQQKLMDESYRRGQNGKRNPEADKRAQQEQEKLRKRLADIMRELGEKTGKVPKNLGDAEREMRRSQRELRRGRPGQSVPPQARALRELRKGARQAMRQLAQRYGLRPGGGRNYTSGQRERFGRDRDPLGRRMDGMGPLNNDDVKVPTKGERKRVREILRELRRRAADPNRPKEEREYLRRLLERF
jgi:uncharacterized protein (TIGR02302 family)